MKIDLVYLWCDGNDPVWREKRESYMPSVKKQRKDAQTFSKGRIANNDELRYSLRSVEMYAPWINHIYIVTDNQCPEWLDVNNPKVSIVDHKDIMPAEVLPQFNSCAIEVALHNIKGLSEYFLYANDDMMFGRAVDPSFFIDKDGKIICHFESGAVHDKTETYFTTLANVEKAISEDFGIDMYRKQPHHNIDIYSKSSMREALERYSDWAKFTLSNRYRSNKDMQRHIFSLYAVATGRGVAHYNQNNEPKQKGIKKLFGLYKGIESMVFSLNRLSVMTPKIKRQSPVLICFNDNENTTDTHREQVQILFPKLYPKKSSFEL